MLSSDFALFSTFIRVYNKYVKGRVKLKEGLSKMIEWFKEKGGVIAMLVNGRTDY